jgi:hypothetical protein
LKLKGPLLQSPLTPRKLDEKLDGKPGADAVAGVFSSLRRLAVAGGRLKAKAVVRFPVPLACEVSRAVPRSFERIFTPNHEWRARC